LKPNATDKDKTKDFDQSRDGMVKYVNIFGICLAEERIALRID